MRGSVAMLVLRRDVIRRHKAAVGRPDEARSEKGEQRESSGTRGTTQPHPKECGRASTCTCRPRASRWCGLPRRSSAWRGRECRPRAGPCCRRTASCRWPRACCSAWIDAEACGRASRSVVAPCRASRACRDAQGDRSPDRHDGPKRRPLQLEPHRSRFAGEPEARDDEPSGQSPELSDPEPGHSACTRLLARAGPGTEACGCGQPHPRLWRTSRHDGPTQARWRTSRLWVRKARDPEGTQGRNDSASGRSGVCGALGFRGCHPIGASDGRCLAAFDAGTCGDRSRS